jgi:hypothetical protein
VHLNGCNAYKAPSGPADSVSSVTLQNVADATAAESGDKWNQRLMPCHAPSGSGGSRGTDGDNPDTRTDLCLAAWRFVQLQFLAGWRQQFPFGFRKLGRWLVVVRCWRWRWKRHAGGGYSDTGSGVVVGTKASW